MNALIKVKAVAEIYEGYAGEVLLNPRAIAWAASRGKTCTHVAMMTGADEDTSPLWVLECAYDDFERAWSDALNYSDRFSGAGGGVLSI